MKTTKEVVKEMFKDEEGNDLILTPGQIQIFDMIFKRLNKRNHLMCYTRYGKSFVVALAVLLRVSTFSEKWVIIAPSEKKAKIIMGYIIGHVFDNEYCKKKLDYDKGESLDRLRRERSKSRIVFKHSDGTVGEVYILSADSRNRLSSGDALMGFGAPNVVLDEAALIDNDIESKIFRMLGDNKDNFYLKIGNPFRRNHFLKSWRNSKYKKLRINWQQGVEEGRTTKEFIDESRNKPNFEVLYENKFPVAEAVDDKGWSNLYSDVELDFTKQEIDAKGWIGERVIGVDIARGGGNFNVWVLRTSNYAKIIARNLDPDLMSIAQTTHRLTKEWKVNERNVFTDDTGVGGGVTDRLSEANFYVNPVTLGAKSDDPDKYYNRRAQNYWRLKEWINKGGKLSLQDEWDELKDIKYRTCGFSSAIQIMSKQEMRTYGIESPDAADALMITFDKRPFVERTDAYLKQMKQEFDPYAAI